MEIKDYYYKVHGDIIVNGPFLLPNVHWISPTRGVALKSDDGSPIVENVEKYGYVQAIQRDDAAYMLKDIQLKIINNKYSELVKGLVDGTPDSERESWPKQELEAKAWSLNNSAQTPYIDGLAESRGVDRVWLIGKINEKVALYESAHSKLTGFRQSLEDAIKALPEGHTVSDLIAIDW